MKKNIPFALKSATGFLLGLSLCICSIPADAGTASASGTKDALSQFDVIYREYDTNENGLLHYHYEDSSGNTIEFDSTANSTAASRKKAAFIPSSYDLRELNMTTSIKDQGMTGACWSFAAIKSIESNLAMQGIQTSDQLDLSESHLAWYTYHPSATANDLLYNEGATDTSVFSDNTSAYESGGNAVLSAFILSRWTGAVNETTAPFHAGTTRELTSMANTMATQSENLRYLSDYLVTDIICYDSAGRDKIKEVIMQNGAMNVSYYTSDSYYHTTAANGTSYYQHKISGKNATDYANHSVTIVGWNDNYSKENFGTYKPSSDGAWLIANSYGSSFGDNGYFWLSYEEPTLTEYYSYIATTPETYDNNYQYDAYGWGNAIVNPSADTVAANIFTANNDYQQSLTSVGVYTVANDQPYTVRIYRGVTAGKPQSGTLAATVNGTLQYEGYHTIPLTQAVSLNPGERFSVVVSYQKTNEDTGYIPLEGENFREGSYRVNYTSRAGESFLYKDGEWFDLKNSFTKGIKNNICIKAFTKNGAAASGNITLSKSKATLGVGESFTLNAKAQNIADKTITYTSSNPTVATVNTSGKVTAKSSGSAIITASLASGRFATAAITVKKAPSRITITPSGKTTVKKSKSFRINVTLPAGSYSSHITYTSSKPSIARVNSSGKVTGKKKGTAVITVKTYNGKKAKLRVTVN